MINSLLLTLMLRPKSRVLYNHRWSTVPRIFFKYLRDDDWSGFIRSNFLSNWFFSYFYLSSLVAESIHWRMKREKKWESEGKKSKFAETMKNVHEKKSLRNFLRVIINDWRALVPENKCLMNWMRDTLEGVSGCVKVEKYSAKKCVSGNLFFVVSFKDARFQGHSWESKNDYKRCFVHWKCMKNITELVERSTWFML